MTTNRKIVFLFSGQGSHYRGMGEKLYSTNAVFARSLEKSDEVIRQYTGRSLIEEMYQNKDRNFDDLMITHPAIVAIELAMLDLIYERGIEPDYVAGNSLGEFAAGVSAGIWTREDALEAAIEQARSIVQSVEEGGMLAVINESRHNLEEQVCKSGLYVASENFSKHFTVTGEKAKLDTFQEILDRMEIQYLRLPVNYPFHCPLIENGKAGFIYFSYTAPPLSKPVKGFVSGLYCKEMDELPDDYFWNVVSQPTDFTDFVNYMEDKGPCLYIDLGPSGTSATFVKYNLAPGSTSITHQIMTQFKREKEQLTALDTLLVR